MNIGQLRYLAGLRTRVNSSCILQFCRAGTSFSQVLDSASYHSSVVCNTRTKQRSWLQPKGYFSTSALRYNRENDPNVITSKFPDGELPSKDIMKYVFENADSYGDREALVDGTSGRSYTFSELETLVTKCASALTRRGFKQGDVFCIYSPNNPEYFIILGAVLSIGGIVTTVNNLYKVDELVTQIKHCDATHIITVPDSADNALKAQELVPNIQEIFVFGDDAVNGCTLFQELLDDDGSAFPINVVINEDDVAALLYSSGTTGLPKGVMLTHKNIVSNMWQFASPPGLLSLKPEDCVLGLLPFFHVYGIVVVLLNTIRMGAKVVTLPKFEDKLFLETIQNHKVTFGFLVPPLILFLAKNPMVDEYDLSCLQDVLCGAAPLSVDLASEFQKRLNVPVVRQGYGLTETAPVIVIGETSGKDCGAAGVLLPNTKAQIVDIFSGKSLSTGERGELYISGPQVMKGYLKNPQATADCIDEEGYFHTGDIGYFSEDGNLYIVDRLKELIKYKGAQVAPAELEATLLTHPGVADAAVIGIADEEAGELPKAFVVKKPDNEDLSEEEICKFVEERVAPHKKLRGGVEFMRGIPKTAAGKILRRQLRIRESQK